MYEIFEDGLGRQYIKLDTGNGIKVIPFDEKSYEYQEYLRWLAEGNTPLTEENQE